MYCKARSYPKDWREAAKGGFRLCSQVQAVTHMSLSPKGCHINSTTTPSIFRKRASKNPPRQKSKLHRLVNGAKPRGLSGFLIGLTAHRTTSPPRIVSELRHSVLRFSAFVRIEFRSSLTRFRLLFHLLIC